MPCPDPRAFSCCPALCGQLPIAKVASGVLAVFVALGATPSPPLPSTLGHGVPSQHAVLLPVKPSIEALILNDVTNCLNVPLPYPASSSATHSRETVAHLLLFSSHLPRENVAGVQQSLNHYPLLGSRGGGTRGSFLHL